MKQILSFTVMAMVLSAVVALPVSASTLDLEGDVQSPTNGNIAAIETIVDALAIDLCSVTRVTFKQDSPHQVTCEGQATPTLTATGATVEADLDVTVCANGNCFTLPVEVRPTGGFADYNGGQDTGNNAPTIFTVPEVCQGNICVIDDPKPVKLVDLNNYYVDYFSSEDEVQIFTPFNDNPITFDIERICATTNDDFHDCDNLAPFLTPSI